MHMYGEMNDSVPFYSNLGPSRVLGRCTIKVGSLCWGSRARALRALVRAATTPTVGVCAVGGALAPGPYLLLSSLRLSAGDRNDWGLRALSSLLSAYSRDRRPWDLSRCRYYTEAASRRLCVLCVCAPCGDAAARGGSPRALPGG